MSDDALEIRVRSLYDFDSISRGESRSFARHACLPGAALPRIVPNGPARQRIRLATFATLGRLIPAGGVLMRAAAIASMAK